MPHGPRPVARMGGFGGGDDLLRNSASGSFDRASTAVMNAAEPPRAMLRADGGDGRAGTEVARALVRVGAHVIIAARSMARGSASPRSSGGRRGRGRGRGDDGRSSEHTPRRRRINAVVAPRPERRRRRKVRRRQIPGRRHRHAVRPRVPGQRPLLRAILPTQGAAPARRPQLRGGLSFAHLSSRGGTRVALRGEPPRPLPLSTSSSPSSSPRRLGDPGQGVNVTSAMHTTTEFDEEGRGRAEASFTQLDDPRGYDPINAYAQSKPANILHAVLNERLRQVPRHQGGGHGGGDTAGDDAAGGENTAVSQSPSRCTPARSVASCGIT